jgi:mannose-6-phosphate isomerase-like protein (cupin superfamily)
MSIAAPTDPVIARHDDQREAVWFSSNRMLVRARAQDTGGAYGLVEGFAPVGSGPPLHVHHGADEAFWLIAGTVRVRCADDEFVLEAGDYALLPREVPHTFIVEGTETAHVLTLLSPGGSEAFFADAGRPAEGPGLPPAGPPDVALLSRVGERHGMEILGPPMRPTAGESAR